MIASLPDREFSYKATNAAGSITRGSVRAAHKVDAISLLAQRGLLVVRIDEWHNRLAPAHMQRKLSLPDAAAGLQALAELLSAGLPLTRALIALPDLAPRSWIALQPSLLRSVQDGRSLAEAFAQAPTKLPRVAMGLIRAGEASGRVGASVRHAASILETQHAQRAALTSALAYPAFLAVVGSSTVTLLVVFVFPRMAQLLVDLGQEIPESTRALIAMGEFVSHWFVALALVPALCVAGVRQLLARPRTLKRMHGALLRLPLVGGIRHSAATARICVAMGAMLEEGLPVSRVLTLIDQVVGDEELRARLQVARDLVTQGESFSAAALNTQLFTKPALLMISAGELAGTLPRMLHNASLVEAARAERKIRLMTKFAEPALVLVLGASVMFVAAALLQAVYSITPTV